MHKILAFLCIHFCISINAFAAPSAQSCQRIVSLAPSITETVFALGLEQKLVAVTRFCRYPVAAQSLVKVGGFLDLNIEAVVGARPDLVMGLAESHEVLERIDDLGISTLMLDPRSVAGILDSVTKIGQRCGGNFLALRTQLEKTLADYTDKFSQSKRVATLVLVGNGEDGLYISGKDGFFSELLERVGGQNVFKQGTVAAPTLSAEGLLKLNPEVIIFVAYGSDELPTLESFKQRFAMLKAVKEKRVYVLSEDYASIPGPRFPLLLEKFVQILHGRT